MPDSFLPPEVTLMGPGPSDIHPRVLSALSRPTIGHLDPRFVSMMDEIKELLRYAFQTKNEITMPISAPGSAGMEFCLVNLLEPGEKAIICQNGVFGGRMRDIVGRIGAEAILIEDDWGKPVSPDRLEATLKSHPDAKVVAFVHAETSTGARSDAKALAGIAREHDALVVADTVTSLGGIPVEIDGWGIDAVYSGTQKCLSAPPGLSPISLSERAVARIKNRKAPVVSWFLDLNLLIGYWGEGGKRSYHHTAPVNALYALHEALTILKEEGLPAAHARHAANHRALRDGLAAMGLRYLVEEEYRLPQLNSVFVPDGVDEARVRKVLLEEYQLEIGAGLGAFAGKVWRIGLMGHASSKKNVLHCIGALETVLAEQGAGFERGVALPAARAAYA